MFRGLSCLPALVLCAALSARALGNSVWEWESFDPNQWRSIEVGAAIYWPANADTYTGSDGAPVVAPIVAAYVGKDWAGNALYRADLLANASDPDGDPLAASILYPSSSVSAMQSADRRAVIFTVRPDVSITSDVFRYAVTDGTLVSTRTMRFDDRPPTGPDAITFDLSKNWPSDIQHFSEDPDGDSLAVVKLVTPPRWNDVWVYGNSGISFGLLGRWVGEDWFTVLISDGRGGTRLQNVVVKAGLTFAYGAHTALLGADGRWFGALRVAFQDTGPATAVLLAGGKRFPAKIDFEATHSVTFSNGVSVYFEPYRLAINADWHGHSIDADLVSDFNGQNFAGQYNVIIERHGSTAMHYGFAVARVDRHGRARMSGRMPDGTAWSAGAAVDDNSILPIVAGTGTLSSIAGPWLIQEPNSVNAVAGELTWHHSGVAENLNVGGARYRARPAGLNVFNDTNTTATLALSRPGHNAIQNEMVLTAANLARITKTSLPALQVKVNPASGIFSGYTILAMPDANFTSGDELLSALRAAVIPFSGVIRGDTGFGVLGSGSSAGSVALLPHFAHLFENYGLSWQGSASTGGVVVAGGFEETAFLPGGFLPAPAN